MLRHVLDGRVEPGLGDAERDRIAKEEFISGELAKIDDRNAKAAAERAANPAAFYAKQEAERAAARKKILALSSPSPIAAKGSDARAPLVPHVDNLSAPIVQDAARSTVTGDSVLLAGRVLESDTAPGTFPVEASDRAGCYRTSARMARTRDSDRNAVKHDPGVIGLGTSNGEFVCVSAGSEVGPSAVPAPKPAPKGQAQSGTPPVWSLDMFRNSSASHEETLGAPSEQDGADIGMLALPHSLQGGLHGLKIGDSERYALTIEPYGRPIAVPDAYRRPAPGVVEGHAGRSTAPRHHRTPSATEGMGAGASKENLKDPDGPPCYVSLEATTDAKVVSAVGADSRERRTSLHSHLEAEEGESLPMVLTGPVVGTLGKGHLDQTHALTGSQRLSRPASCILRHSGRASFLGMDGPVSARVPRWTMSCMERLAPLRDADARTTNVQERKGQHVRVTGKFAGMRGMVSAHIPSGVAASPAKSRGRNRRARRRKRSRRCDTLLRTGCGPAAYTPVSVSWLQSGDCGEGAPVKGDEGTPPVCAPKEEVLSTKSAAAIENRLQVATEEPESVSADVVDINKTVPNQLKEEGRAPVEITTHASGAECRGITSASQGGNSREMGSERGSDTGDVAGVQGPSGGRAEEGDDACAEPRNVLDIHADASGVKIKVQVRLEDWESMVELGFCEVAPGAVIATAYRRLAPKASVLVRLRDRNGMEVRSNSEPQSWEELVRFVDSGGTCILQGRMRGGMDPKHQATIAATAFDDRLRWDEIDSIMESIRSGGALAEGTDPQLRDLAEALATVPHLQQWDPMAALPEDIRRCCVCSPARLAALQCIGLRREADEEGTPPGWTSRGHFLEVRWNEIPEVGIQLDHANGGNGRAQLQDMLMSRLLSAAPAITGSPQYDLAELRDSIHIESNLDLGFPFSATMVVPVGPWVQDMLSGRFSLGGDSFCTVTAVGTHVEVALPNPGSQLINTIRGCLRVSRRAFQTILNDSFRRALQCTFVTTRNTTSRVVHQGKNKRTVENFGPGSGDSVVMVGTEATRLLMVRRERLELQVRLGYGQECPVALRIGCPQCPQRILHGLLEQRNPPPLRPLSHAGSLPVHPILLIGPLAKGWSARLGYPPRERARMQELQRNIAQTARGLVGARSTRLIGRHDKEHSPLYVYMEFERLEQSQLLVRQWEEGTCPQGFQDLWQYLVGGDTSGLRLWSCGVLVEALMVASDKTLKELVAAGEAHPCPLPPPPAPPPPAPPQAAGRSDALRA